MELKQCQARRCTDLGKARDRVDARCEEPGTVQDPRGPCFCWTHSKAFNNPARSTPLRLHKSATDGFSA